VPADSHQVGSGVVVGFGEAAACAGTITDLTSGFVHWLGNIKVVAMPPIVAIFRIRLRSGAFRFGSIPPAPPV
jgi:hypothetical protein